jgi:hypothetical protein
MQSVPADGAPSRPRHPNAPRMEGTARSNWKPSIAPPGTGRHVPIATRRLMPEPSGIYLRADPSDLQEFDGASEEERAELIAYRLREWKSAANT